MNADEGPWPNDDMLMTAPELSECSLLNSAKLRSGHGWPSVLMSNDEHL